MDARNLRIVLSGPVGSGKTSLAKMLAQRLNLPLIGEGMKDIHLALDAHNNLIKNPLTIPSERKQAGEVLIESFFKWAADRKQQCAENQGFIADRWEADLLDLWLKMFAESTRSKETIRLLRDMRSAAKSLSFAVLLPPQHFVVENENEDGLKRKQSFNLTFLAYIMTGGLIRQCPDLPLITLPARPMSIEERVDWVSSFIQKNSGHGLSVS